MPGPTPKHPSEKIRRSKPAVPPVKLPLHHNLKAPRIPKAYPWTDVGKDYWKTLWASPMALIFIPADHPALVRMTVLTEIVALGEMHPQILSELRQLEDRFGMSPLSRRRLQFDVDLAANRTKPESEREPENDSRWLRVVESS